jgi:hypothetical protein
MEGKEIALLKVVMKWKRFFLPEICSEAEA